MDTIEHRAVQGYVHICEGPKTLDEGDRASGRLTAFGARLLDRMRGDDQLNDLPYRREQFGVGGKKAA